MRRKDEEHSLKMEEREKKEAEEREQEREKNIRREMELKRERLVGGGGGDDMDREEGVSPPPSKRPHPSEELRTESRGEVHGITGLTLPQGVNLPGTNIKITSRGQYLLINKSFLGNSKQQGKQYFSIPNTVSCENGKKMGMITCWSFYLIVGIFFPNTNT